MQADPWFWDIIDRTVPAAGPGTDAHAEAITDALKEMAASAIVDFQTSLEQQSARACRWDLWAVAYIALGGCSDDGFDYFRRWLVAQGREYFERALDDPQRAADALSPGDEAECEGLGYAAMEAYEQKTGTDFPDDDVPRFSSEPSGESWDEDAVYDLYPELAKRFA